MVSILVAVDSDLEREGVKSILSRERDMRVVAATDNGRHAVVLAGRHKPDIALLSVLMTELNGVGAARKIREMLPKCCVIGICSAPDPMMVRRMFSAGASGYLCKECTGSHVVAAVREVSRGGMYVGPHAEKAIVADYSKILAGESAPMLWSLTFREREVLQLIAEGKTTKNIALMLEVSPKTVEAHRANIMSKLGLYSVAELTRYAIEENITPSSGSNSSASLRRRATGKRKRRS